MGLEDFGCVVVRMLSRVVSLVVFVLGIFIIYACSSPAPSEDPAAFPLKPKSNNLPNNDGPDSEDEDDDDPDNPNTPTGPAGAGPDVTAPVIQLQGANPLVLSSCQRFVDPGATATDDRDGTVNVTVVVNFNDALQGNYQALYQATDSAGNQSQVFRSVQVQGNSIYSSADLDSMRPAANMNKNFKVCNDIDLSATPEFIPIGSSSQKYNGIFEGANPANPPTISGLNISNNSTDDKGLFASLGSNAIIRNLKFESFQILSPGRKNIGTIAGRSEALIENIQLKDIEISGDHDVGSLVGAQIGSSIKNIVIESGEILSTGQIPGGVSSKSIGGLAGSLSNVLLENIQIGDEESLQDFKITLRYISRVGGISAMSTSNSIHKNLKFFGIIARQDTCQSSSCASGGLFGQASAKIHDSVVKADLSFGSNTFRSGGFIGYSSSSVTEIFNSQAEIDLSAGSEVGGFVGYMEQTSVTSDPTIYRSYVKGVVQGSSSVGGLVGEAYKRVNISQSYSEALVTGSTNVGGLIGDAQSSGGSSKPTISNSYSVGDIVGDSQTGGLVGKGSATVEYSLVVSKVSDSDPSPSSTVNGLVGNVDSVSVQASFWDEDINYDLDDSGSGPNGSTDRSTEQLTETPVTYNGWSATIWEIPTTTNHFYPRIKNLPNTLLRSLTEGAAQ